MGKSPCCDKNIGIIKKGAWTVEEDQKLIDYIKKHGHGRWRTLAKNAGLKRLGKSCRFRWTNYLRPGIKRGKFSYEEVETIMQLHRILGNKWSAIAARLPGRTGNEIKNYWNTHIGKRLLSMGIDPVTHTPRHDLSELISSILNPNLLHMATSLFLSQCKNPDIQQNQLDNTQTLQASQNPIQEIQSCPTSSTPFQCEPKLQQFFMEYEFFPGKNGRGTSSKEMEFPTEASVAVGGEASYLTTTAFSVTSNSVDLSLKLSN